MIPIIESGGGKVLVRANVSRILYDGSKVTGVRVKKGSEQHEILAPVVISNAG
jgi:phytoene dehydrogenase-like protein